MPRLVVPARKGVKQPRVFCFVVNRDEETSQRAGIRSCILPGRGREQVIGVVVGRIHRCVEDAHSAGFISLGQ